MRHPEFFHISFHGSLFTICPSPEVREAIEMVGSYLKTSGITFKGSMPALVYDGRHWHIASVIRGDDL